jgi:hypothetical protein
MLRFAVAGALALAALPLTTAGAQGRQSGPGNALGRMNEELVDSLRVQAGLTDEQVAAVNGIFKAGAERRQEIMAKYRGQQNRNGFQAMRPEMEAVRAEMDEQLELVLTQQQMERYHALRARLQERFRSQRGGRRPQGSR